MKYFLPQIEYLTQKSLKIAWFQFSFLNIKAETQWGFRDGIIGYAKFSNFKLKNKLAISRNDETKIPKYEEWLKNYFQKFEHSN